jgi:hypothetical protein
LEAVAAAPVMRAGGEDFFALAFAATTPREDVVVVDADLVAEAAGELGDVSDALPPPLPVSVLARVGIAYLMSFSYLMRKCQALWL